MITKTETSSPLLGLSMARIIRCSLFFMAILMGTCLPNRLCSQTTHSYYFQGNFNEGSGGPALTEVLSCSASNGNFTNQTIVTNAGNCGSGPQQVFAFNSGGGFSYPNNTFIGGTYTVNMFFKFNEMTGYQRIIDFKNGTTDNGLYTLTDCLNFFPNNNQGTCPFFSPNVYYLITLVRDGATNLVKVYVNGSIFVNNYNDASGDYAPTTSSTPVIMFRDNVPPSSANCEDSPGAVKFLSFKNATSTDAEVLAIWNNICNIAAGCTPPTITCPGDVVQTVVPGDCNAVVNYPPATSNGTSIIYSQNSGTSFPIGVTTVTATAILDDCTTPCTFTVTVTAPEINLEGNGLSIDDGAITTTTANHTDFGTVNVGSSLLRTFTIQNPGTYGLNVSTITKTGANTGDFSISGIALPAAISAGNSTTFNVTFYPAAGGSRAAVIHVASDDCDEADYDFAILGTGNVEAPLVETGTAGSTTTVSSIITGNDITSIGTSTPSVRGVCWNNSGDPTVANSKTVDNGSFTTGLFSATMTGLSANTAYYVKAYATNSEGTGYGQQVTFTTLPDDPALPVAVPSTICNGDGSSLSVSNQQGTVYWYTGSCGGTLAGTGNPFSVNPAVSTTYYAKNFNGGWSTGCSSVEVTVNQPSYAGTPPTIADLQLTTGVNIKWYPAATGGTLYESTTLLINGYHYYASQTVNGCESTARFEVIALVDLTPCAPEATSPQTFSVGATVADLTATGADIRWYSVSTGGTVLAPPTLLENGTYWASQRIDCTESAKRTGVTVIIN